jgi:exopolyphosphatase / guanosine-5'-triphosphate,3'-diphosphate pyrophosphatase
LVYASIDIGTNAVLLFIVDLTGDNREILDVSTITRLGEGLIRTGELSPAAMRRTFEALEKYAEMAGEHNVDQVVCYGTSALREARNSSQFIEQVEERLGWRINVISTYQEAYYTYLSVREDPAMAGPDWMIVDIGGGSTEVIQGNDQRFLEYVSLPVGTVKLTDMFVKHDPPLEQEIHRLTAYIRSTLAFSCPPQQTLVGMAGTMTTFGAMIKRISFDKQAIHGMTIPLSTFDVWIEKMKTMTVAERRELPGMEPGREDLLFQGLVLMREIMRYCRSSSLTVNTHGARYGILYEMVKKSR